ncbi:hypothetical protein [Riemerella columbipharyngis]|uniref:Lipoprotein n=1 Tax=Riemerella columbipharyngis TaxID=1071918 RepID=A0A1G6ZPX5_9FLAO|nr:hypothetical protein [Riemerella columbipharyngis]SDE04542.1 hypothetical protein SAMN05421544_102161 [Riemerella columbipharyngis]
MKIKTLSTMMLLSGILASCNSWVKIGNLNSISNRNIDDSKQYSLISRDVEAEAKSGSDALEQAVDNLTGKYQGEFVRNAKIYVKDNGEKVKVIGDVWGVQNTITNIKTVANAEIDLKIGDSVVFKRKGDITEGKIIGIGAEKVVVEYGRKGRKKIELRFDEITKTNKELK